MRRFVRVVFFVIVVLFVTIGFQVSNSAQESQGVIHNLIEHIYPSLEKLYHYLHSHPELSFREEKTSARLASELRNLGFEVTTRIGGYGIVGVLKNGNGPTVLIRTDMDALPIVEQTGLPYMSTVRVKDENGNEVGVMHACGHDVHMTVFIGTARLLTQLKDRWQGTLVMIGQPAEERGAGAHAMLNDGLFKRFPLPDYCLALHVAADLTAGKVGYSSGYAMANVDSVDIEIRGVGGHGASPHMTKDPILLASQIILGLQTIISREVNPREAAVITVGSLHSGTKRNIIPDTAYLQLTVRSYSEEVRNQLLTAIRRITEGIAVAAGVPQERMPKIKIVDFYTPSLFNDPLLTERLVTALQNALGKNRVVTREPEMIGEDFARYGRTEHKIPICMLRLGTVEWKERGGNEPSGSPLASLHSASFAPVAEPTIKGGVEVMTVAVLKCMEKKK